MTPKELRELINESGLTGRELAKKAGVSEQHLSSVLNGKKRITNSFAALMEKTLKKGF